MRLRLTCYALTFGLATAQQLNERYGAVPVAPNGLMPRFFLDKSNPVAKRDVDCGDDSHSCLDVGFGDQCCDNDTYCYVNRSGNPKCCPIGSNCTSDSPCDSSSYYCTRTTTASGTPSAQVGCCGRSCPETSLFLCAASLGGNCCSYGATCRVGGECTSVKTATQSNLLTPIQSGCTTSQHKCADGSGCCDNSQVCTEVSNTGYCVAGNPSETISVIENPNKSGLSTGAKAGIGVGAVVGTSIVVGFLTWLCISKRRHRQRTLSRHSRGDGSGTGGQESAPVDAMTDVSGTDHSRVRQGLTQDYFGPDAVAGPYTETAASPERSPGYSRAVPTRPDGPGDITAAVEIDSNAKENIDNSYLSPNSNTSPAPTPQSENVEGRFELYGSEGREPLSIVPTPQESPYVRTSRPAE